MARMIPNVVAHCNGKPLPIENFCFLQFNHVEHVDRVDLLHVSTCFYTANPLQKEGFLLPLYISDKPLSAQNHRFLDQFR